MDILKFLFGIVIVSAFVQPITGVCRAMSGPSGIVECFSDNFYGGKYQWGTCITDAYLKQSSKGKYYCRDKTANYCYYQCMLEEHDISEGPVYDDCSCRPGDAPPSSEAPLPAWCYSPDGTECSWYRRCLEKRFPCTGTEASYALDYGEKFCNLYTENYNGFDAIGQEWIDAVRKCLQVALVPLLRPYTHPSCKEIKDTAFRSHSGCYLNPYPGAPSVCDIGLSNFWKVYCTIKPAFLSDPWATVLQGLETVSHCVIKKVLEAFVKFIIYVFRKVVEIVIDLIRMWLKIYFSRHGINPDGVVIYFDVGTSDDFYRHKRSTDPSNSTMISVLLFDRKIYDLNYKNASNISIDGVINKLMDDIETGQYQLNIGIPIEEISLCPDIECQNVTRIVVPFPEEHSTEVPGLKKETTEVPGPEKDSTEVPGPEKESTGLAFGAVIGIVVGVLVVVVLLGALVFFFIRKM